MPIKTQKDKKWYFVCGKGYVGKTVVASGIALNLSKLSEKHSASTDKVEKTKSLKDKSLLSRTGKSLYISDYEGRGLLKNIKRERKNNSGGSEFSEEGKKEENKNVKNEEKFDKKSDLNENLDFEKQADLKKYKKLKTETKEPEKDAKLNSTLLVSPEDLENLTETLGQDIQPGVTPITDSLDVLRLDKSNCFDDTKNDESPLSPVLNSILLLPGIKEALFISNVIDQSEKYDCVVIDTWPSFSFLNFLSFPDELSTLLNKIIALDDCKSLENTKLYKKLMYVKENIRKSKIAQDSSFALVSIPEGFSLDETTFMIEQLSLYDLNIHNLIINQILIENKDCDNCKAIYERQSKFLDLLRKCELNKTEIDFIPKGIKGKEQLEEFAEEYL